MSTKYSHLMEELMDENLHPILGNFSYLGVLVVLFCCPHYHLYYGLHDLLTSGGLHYYDQHADLADLSAADLSIGEANYFHEFRDFQSRPDYCFRYGRYLTNFGLSRDFRFRLGGPLRGPYPFDFGCLFVCLAAAADVAHLINDGHFVGILPHALPLCQRYLWYFDLEKK